MSKKRDLSLHTMPLSEAADFARELGATVAIPKATGELRFSYQGIPCVRANSRKPEASKEVMSFLRRLVRFKATEACKVG